MRLRKAAREKRSSDYRNNDVSLISEVKDTSNVALRRKRGRRAPPLKSLRGKKVDKVIDSDESDSVAHIEECVEGRTGDLDLPKTGQSEKERNTSRSKQDTRHLKQDGVDSEPTGQNGLTNEDGSNVQAAGVKSMDEDRSSQEIKADQVSDVQLHTTSSEDKSSEEVEDVKVCDICGDVGEEEKLAVCRRCNDGAEHTYCMRVMLEEVPEGEWLCEDCQTEVDGKEKELEKCKVNASTSKGQSFEDEPVNAAKSRSSSDSEVEAENVGNEESDNANQGNDMVNNRMEEDRRICSSVRKTITDPSGLNMGVDSRKRMPPSCESSSRFDVDKGKQPSHQVATSLASNAPKNQAPPLRGQLSKSTSFNNSKVPKVKQLLNEVPQKPKSLKDTLSSIMKKEGPISMTTKSPFFKKPKSCELANKAKSSILSPAEEPRVTNPLVTRNVTNDRGTSILVWPSTTASMIAPVSSKADSTAQHLPTVNNMSDSDKLSIAHEQGGRNSLGHSELKKPLLAKVPGSMMISNAEKSSGILGSGAQRKAIQNSDPSYQDDKIKDTSSFRPGASSSNRTIRCQRCNEAGHSTQFCAVDKLHLSAIKPLSERNLKDPSAKRNKTSETGTLLATEKAASRSADQSEQVVTCGPYQNPIYRPKDVLSTSFSHVKKPAPLFMRTNEQDMGPSFSTPGSTASVDCSKLKFKDDYSTLSATIGRSVDNGSTRPSDHSNKSSQDFSNVDEPIASTAPELDYIWQGGFELWRTGRSPELCDGFQAHLSCSASPVVLEVAKKFPSKVQLEELPRQNSWPTQFQKNGPTYDNVGLFFFARDTQSYENHYSKLVENMLKNDLVLRGSVDTVELLIFPSNILSKNIQRWNMFYFLWGVFRVIRKDCLNLPHDAPTSRCQSNLSEDPRAVDPSTSVLSSSHSFSNDMNNFAKPDPNLVKSATCAEYQCLTSLEANHQGCSNAENSFNQPASGRPLVGHHESVTAGCSTNNNGGIDHSASVTEIKQQKLDHSEQQDKMQGTFIGNVSERDLDVNMVPADCSIPLIHEEEPGKESKAINLNDAEHLMDIDLVITAEVNTGALDPFSHAAGSACKRDFEMVNGADEVDGALEHKKIKLDNIAPANSGLCENINDGRLSSKVHPLAASSVDDGTGNKAMAGSSNSDGKSMFPLDLNAVDDAVSGSIVNILSSDDEKLPEAGVPDLELEMRDDKSSERAMLPSLSPKDGEKENKADNLPTDITGSLSLSLSLGFSSTNEPAIKPQSEPERQLP